MKITGRILLSMLAILCVTIITGILLPRNKVLTYATTINAPPYLVFDCVNHLKQWQDWFPSTNGESYRFEAIPGKTSGTGASGLVKNRGLLTGDSIMTITESDPYQSITVDISLLAKGTTSHHWSFEELAEGTEVRWQVILEDMGIFERYNGLILNRIIGPYCAQGLDNLKSACEQSAALYPESCSVIEVEELKPQEALFLVDTCAEEAVSKTLQSIYSQLTIYARISGLATGPDLFAVYHPASAEGTVVVEGGLFISGSAPGTGRIRRTSTPSGRHVVAVVRGTYESLEPVYGMMERFIADSQLKMSGPRWEVYRTGPQAEAGTALQETILYIPVE